MTEYTFRKAKLEDSKLIYDFAMDDGVRKSSVHSEIFTYESHCAWFRKRLADNNYHILLYGDDLLNIGMVRLEQTGNEFLLSYQIANEYRGRGFGEKMLQCLYPYLQNAFHEIKVIAYVKNSNMISIKTLLKCGYVLINNSNEELLKYEKNNR